MTPRAAPAGRRGRPRDHRDRPLPRAGWSASAGSRFDDYDGAAPLVGRRPRRVLVGDLRSSSAVRFAHPAERGARPARDAGRGVVPRRDAELRRARASALDDRRDADEVAVLAYSQTRDRHRADLGRAARPGRPGPGRAAAARRRPRRPGRRRTCRTSPRRWSRSWPPRAWARSGRAARRSSAPAAWSTGSARSSRRCCWPSPATATAPRTSTAATEVAEIRAGLPTRAARRRTSPTGANDVARRASAGTSCSAEPRRARLRPGAVRPPAVRAVLLRHHRASRRRSCTATAGSCSST